MLSPILSIVTDCTYKPYGAFIPFISPALCASSSKLPRLTFFFSPSLSPMNQTFSWLLTADTSPLNWPTTPALLLNLWKVSFRELMFAPLSFLTARPTLHVHHIQWEVSCRRDGPPQLVLLCRDRDSAHPRRGQDVPRGSLPRGRHVFINSCLLMNRRSL